MATNSDHAKPFNDINKYLPEVYKSDVNRSVFDMAFNRHLTKDDTTRVAGFIGEGNPDALVDRQIKEATPHRQAYQLTPTMYSKVGTVESSLSFKAFLAQLELMGVDIDRLPKWGNTTQFNWVPPINIDMLINYQDYFWKPDSPQDAAQYFTIENRCNKANSKVQSYQNVLLQRGDTFPVIQINYATNDFVIAGKSDDLFVSAFEFYTKGATNVNLQNKFWTVNEPTYDFEANETTINVIEPIAIIADTAPIATYIGQWWYNTLLATLNEWNGTIWTPAVQAQAVTISLAEQLLVYQAQANCVCSQDFGWDMAAWDDNQEGTTPWSAGWFATITFDTDTQWIIANGAPTIGDTWYNPITDTLNSYNGSTWVSSLASFSTVIDRLTGNARWDFTVGCDAQELNQWSSQNRWIHKSQVQSYADVRRAQVPILEYNSLVELNQWSKYNYVWKYRTNIDDSFVTTSLQPTRIELEPIKGYVAQNSGGSWFLYLFASDKTINRDIDYTKSFIPGYRFRIQDDTLISQVYTVSSSEYREIVASDPVGITTTTGVNYFVTVIKLVETTFTSATIGGGIQNVRIEPLFTSTGDTWRGYHAHWMLDEAATTSSAAANQPLDPYLREGLEASIPPVLVSSLPVHGVTHTDAGGAFVPAVTSITIGTAHQQLIIDIAGVTQIDLLDRFRYTPSTSTVYGTPGSNEVRVYVNDVRQYANYTEILGTAAPNYTLIGQTTYTTQSISYVQSIVFNEPLEMLDVVRIEVGAAALSDLGMFSVPVRTTEDEATFTIAAVNGLQPVYRSLTTYQKLDQAKTSVNQYPLFNVYNLITSEVIAGSQLFGFREDSSATINGAVQRRIVAASDGREYEFEQYLLDRDDNLLYGYRNASLSPTYWYSSLLNTVKYWDGKGWQTDILMTLSSGARVTRTPVIAALAPSNLLTVDQALWFDTVNNKLFRRNLATTAWIELTNVIINGSDPSLITVWRHGATNSQYVPEYVDSKRVPITVGDVNGDWGVVDQWFYNPEHHNRKVVKYTQVVTHFRTILEAQTRIPGLLGGGIYTLTQEDYDYSAGGTIKEHNDSFDTLISAVNVTNVTPPGVIDFASQQYASGLLFVRDLFNKMTVELFGSYSHASLSDFAGFIDDLIITRYESNDFTAQIFGDTSAYNSSTDVGVRNWVTTIPMMALGEKFQPHLNVFDGLVQLFHHDGHRSAIFYTAAEQDKYSRIICNITDPRGGLFGRIAPTTFPTTESAFVTAFGFAMRPGMYWYHVGGGTRKLYRFEAYDITPTAPGFYDINGVEIADGTMYYNIGIDATFEKVGLSWIQVTTTGAGDITPIWREIDFALLLGEVLLELEQRLYDVTPTLPPAFDYSTLTPTVDEQDVFDQLQRSRFEAYVATNNITTPFANTLYSLTNAFTWNYSASLPTILPTVIVPAPLAGAWQAVYTAWYGTPYPHVEPWKLQGFHDKPTWWDAQYKDQTGLRRWVYTHATTTGMWENIRTGQVPAGRTYPDGTLSSGNSVADGQTLPEYNYFSVNISDSAVPGGYSPDDLLPPYYDNSTIAVALPTVRSLFVDLNAEVNAPDADYAYGDMGPVEWAWSVSNQHPYDLPTVAFQMQPARFLHYAFGPQFILVDSLQVETTVQQVYSHEDVLFHGDVFNVDQTYTVRGLNQWYVNYNRYSGFDTNGEFRQLWAGWNPRLTYQYGGIVDTSTFEIGSKYYDVINQDFEIILANNGVFRDLWMDAFKVSLLHVPPALIQYNNQAQWKMEVDSLASVERSISYYGVKQYPFSASPSTDVCSAFTYPILSGNAPARRFGIDGDQTGVFTPGLQFTVTNSTANDGIYTVETSVFETSTNRTRVNVVESVAGSIGDGLISVAGFALPWNTGDEVVVSSTKFLPAPLQPNIPYYVIKLTNQTFKLAESPTNATSNIAIDLTSRGEGTLHVAQLDSSFLVFGGAGNTQDVWYHYAIDKTNIRTFTPPYTILGMQTLINIIDGYSTYQKDQGVLYGIADSSDFDPNTGRLITWSLETERFIDWAYGLRQARIVFSDMYPITANASTDELTFISATPSWISGTAVVVSSTGTLPAPLQANTQYYVANTTTSGIFKLSISANTNDLSSIVDLSTSGSGVISVGLYEKNRAYPRFEMNPSRNNAWIETPLGVLSNVVSGPYTDIRVQQTIFDQYGRPIGPDKLTVYREDKRGHIAIRPELTNDVDPIYQNDPYNYIHIGGGHFFVEGYEHFLIFNDYTVGGALIYDPFLGLNTKKFDVDYFEKEDYTLRPTLGGYYLLNGQFNRNIEGTASDMQNYYDTLALSETTDIAKRARSILGYRGRQQFLDLLDINSKSQFLFYRGMIQTKGSVNSVKAFINSRRFVDAKVDEFWAWKLAEFGDSRIRVYPEIKLFSTDGALDDVRLEFLGNSELETDADVIDAVSKGFQIVSFKDGNRWNIFPEQKQLIQSSLFLDTEVSSLTLIHSGPTYPHPGTETTISQWFDTESQQLFEYNVATQLWDIPVTNNKIVVQTINVGDPVIATECVYYRLDTPCDDVRVLRRTLSQQTFNIISCTSPNTITLSGNRTADITVDVPFLITSTISNDGAYTPSAVVFNGTDTVITVSGGITTQGVGGFIQTQDFSNYTTEFYNPGSGEREFTKVDSEVVRFDLTGFADVIMIFTINPAKTQLSPAKLIDTKSEVVIQQLPMWDPARGHHSHIAAHNVDLFFNGDPARYEFTPNPTDATQNFWNQAEVGRVWLDTSYLGYLPYFDDKVFPNVNDRLYNWGKLALWGSVRVYQWVRSTVPPSEWDALVLAQSTDASIPQNEKATGTPRRPVFKRVREGTVVTASVSTNRITMSPLTVAVNDQVLFTTTGTLPENIVAGTKYIVTNISGATFQLLDPDVETVVDIGPDAGTGVLTLVPAFVANDWNNQSLINDRITAPFAMRLSRALASIPASTTFTWGSTTLSNDRLVWNPATPSAWVTGTGIGSDQVDIYVNGVLHDTGLSIIAATSTQFYVTLTTGYTPNEFDIIDIIRPVHDITPSELEFDPDVDDDGTQLIQWKEDYEYSSNTLTTGGINTGSTPTTYYYFWVENATVRDESSQSNLSVFEIAQQIETIPTPYFIVQRPKDDPYLVEKYGYGMIEYGSVYSLGSLREQDYQIPVLYREAIIRKVASYINDDDRYVIRFTRDMTLRDDIQDNGRQMNLKNRHQEWFMFRREQTNTIPQELWNRLTEALMGYTLADSSVRVPALERELYDATYQTDTRFGLGVDQAFVDRTLGLSTVIAYLQDPTKDFSPTDIDAFFATNSFTTPESIRVAMNTIYTTFAAEHVNAIWFETLHDALSTRAKYRELMKTSWIALHGIRILEIGGAFDD